MEISRYNKILDKAVLDRAISKCFSEDALVIYLWKRDLQYANNNLDSFILNCENNYNYRVTLDSIILEYLLLVDDLIPKDISNDYKLNLLIHIASIMIFERYLDWKDYISSLINKYNHYELLKIIKNISLEDIVTNYESEFLFIRDKDRKVLQLYYD